MGVFDSLSAAPAAVSFGPASFPCDGGPPMTMSKDEVDLRLAMLNSVLTCPHRKLGLVHPLHAELVKQDPRFYVRLGAWYADHGDVRDHKEMFIVTLILSEFEGHRDVGLAMLRSLPPYEVVRVLDFIHGRKKTKTVRAEPKDGKKGAKRPAKEAASAPAQNVVEEFG